MYFLYSLLTAIGMLLLLPYFLARGLRQGKSLDHIVERLGWLPVEVRTPTGSPGAIWVHAVSVGEALAAVPLARRLQERFPERRLVVSTTTITGQRVARERLDFADGVFYFPLDWAGPVRRALRAVRPALVIILETEIWPNFLREAQRAGVPVVFANGRISERSFRGYRRLNRFLGGFLTRALATADLLLMQSEADARRLRELGAPAERVKVVGNLKYDLVVPASSPLAAYLEQVLRRHDRRPVIVAGSVTAGEEPLVLSAFGFVQNHWPRALLVLAPRKPERFAAAAELIEGSDREFLRRSAMTLDMAGGTSLDGALDEETSVLLLDSVGELAALYRLADAVFVGGSLVPAGGHNILEPAAFGKPPLFGPSMENFQEMAAMFLKARAARQVHSPEDLGGAWLELVRDSARREEMGRAARELVERNRGATERSLEHIAGFLRSR